jgi:hypothetical protein
LYGLSPEKLSRFLAIGLEHSNNQDGPHLEETSDQAVQRILNAKLSDVSSIRDSLPEILNRLPNTAPPAADQTMGAALVDRRTPLALIETLKDHCKSLVRQAPSKDEQAAASAVYYAAIANALVFHKHKITQHSYEKLQKAFAVLEQKAWVPSDLKDLFEKATAACQERKA